MDVSVPKGYEGLLTKSRHISGKAHTIGYPFIWNVEGSHHRALWMILAVSMILSLVKYHGIYTRRGRTNKGNSEAS